MNAQAQANGRGHAVASVSAANLSTLSIRYVSVLIEAAVGGLLVTIYLTWVLLRFPDRIPDRTRHDSLKSAFGADRTASLVLRSRMDRTQVFDLLIVLVPIAAGAVVAGISAWLKTQFDRRDAYKQTQRRLALATARTEFVSTLFDISTRIGGGEEYRATVAERGRVELEDAYRDAQEAVESGRSAAEKLGQHDFVWQLRRLLALGPYSNRRTYAVSWVLYVVFGVLASFLTLGAAVGGPTEGEAPLIVQILATNGSIYILFRGLAQLPIMFLERHARSPDSQASTTKVAPADSPLPGPHQA